MSNTRKPGKPRKSVAATALTGVSGASLVFAAVTSHHDTGPLLPSYPPHAAPVPAVVPDRFHNEIPRPVLPTFETSIGSVTTGTINPFVALHRPGLFDF